MFWKFPHTHVCVSYQMHVPEGRRKRAASTACVVPIAVVAVRTGMPCVSVVVWCGLFPPPALSWVGPIGGLLAAYLLGATGARNARWGGLGLSWACFSITWSTGRRLWWSGHEFGRLSAPPFITEHSKYKSALKPGTCFTLLARYPKMRSMNQKPVA